MLEAEYHIQMQVDNTLDEQDINPASEKGHITTGTQ
jgi:hypothetical protein